MGFFRDTFTGTADRRKIADRRTQEKKLTYDLRVRPARRLNNISVEWIPISEINLHPALCETLVSVRNRKKET